MEIVLLDEEVLMGYFENLLDNVKVLLRYFELLLEGLVDNFEIDVSNFWRCFWFGVWGFVEM